MTERISIEASKGIDIKRPVVNWLLRASNTQAVLVARCESRTIEGLARLKAALVEQLTLSRVKTPDLG